MTHGHDILHMMEGNTYHTKSDLVKAVVEKFGPQETFHTCSAEGMNAEEIVDFLDGRGKFMRTPDGGFTVDITKVCNH
ncbi:MAG: YecH family protein [Prevotella sp.]|nr:YecH family protein [Prevotella sp.]